MQQAESATAKFWKQFEVILKSQTSAAKTNFNQRSILPMSSLTA